MKIQARFRFVFLFLLAVPTFLDLVAAHENLSFEFIGNDDETWIGFIVSLDAEKFMLYRDDSKTSVLRERLETVRNCSDNPYFIKDSVSAMAKDDSKVDTRKRSTRNISLPRPKALVDSAKSEYESGPVLHWPFPDSVCVIELVDGSRLVATSLASEGRTIKTKLLRSPSQSKDTEPLELSIASIHSIRFNIKSLENVSVSSDAWQKLSSTKDGKGDQLVVGQGEKLDLYRGALVSLTDETVSFSVDGETLPVPRRKIFGLLLHQSSTDNSGSNKDRKMSSEGNLTLWNGSQIAFQSLATDEQGNVQWTSLSGVSGFCVLEEIDQILFRQNDVVFLSDLPIRILKQTLPFQWNKETNDSSPSKLFEAFRTNRINIGEKKASKNALDLLLPNVQKTARDKRFSMLFNQPLPDLAGICFDGSVYTKGLMVPMGTTLEWTLSEPYGSLRGAVGFDDRFRPEGRARLVIQSGTSLVFDQIIQGNEKFKQLKIDLPDGTRSLTVMVDYIDGFADTIPLGIADFKLFK